MQDINEGDYLRAKNYIKQINMPICAYVVFIVSSIVIIGLLIFLWHCMYPCDCRDIFVITSILVGIMTVFIVTFAIISLIFSDESRKHALLTYAYDEALKKVGERCDKKTTTTFHNNNTVSKKEEIEYGVRAITQIFETYCQNITAK